MGVAVPEDYRREVAMAGDWQTLSERPVYGHVKKEEGQDDFKGFKPDTTLNVGVRKRKLDGEEEDEEAGRTTIRKGWGSAVRQYPGSTADNADDLDDLLNNTKPHSERDVRVQTGDSLEPNTGNLLAAQDNQEQVAEPKPLSVKKEDSEDYNIENFTNQDGLAAAVIKQETEDPGPTVVFKKRKAKLSKS